MRELTEGLTDKLYGNKGYLGKVLEADLLKKSVSLIITVRKNMKVKKVMWLRN